MPSILASLPTGSRIAVLRLRSLGDCVLTTPAIRILKDFRPDLEIAVVAEDRFSAVFEDNPDIRAILPPSALALARFRPALALNLHGGGTSARLTALSGARRRAGFAHFRWPLLYGIRIPRAQEILGVERKVHTAEHLASAAIYLGGLDRRMDIPSAKLFSTQAPKDVSSAFAVIHPFASEPAKRWPAERFLNVAQHIRRSLDLEPVFIGGPGDDLTPFQVWNTISGVSLHPIKALLKHATLFLGNDSGPAHMAAAFSVPTVVIFGPSDPVIWAPWKTVSEVLVANGPIESVPESRVFRAIDHLRVHA